MSAATTFGALAPGARFRLFPDGPVWCKVDGLGRDYGGPTPDPRMTGYSLADDRKVYPLSDAEYLEHLRGEIRAERISWGELADLQGMAELIDPGDVELLEWADPAPCRWCGAAVAPVTGGKYPEGRPLATTAENDPYCPVADLGRHETEETCP